MDDLSNPETWSLRNLLQDVILSHMILPQVPKYECKDCKKFFSKKDKLTKHIQIKHQENPEWFSCPTCGKQFNRQDSLRRHLRSHNPERPFKCDVCKTGFRRRDHLSRHINTPRHKNTADDDISK